MKNKRGYSYWIISIILSVMVMSIVLYWIFQEYFNEESINSEVCKQSILLRNTLPRVNIAGIAYKDFKNSYPLKCKTDTINIDYENKTIATKVIMDKIAECWYIMGQGNYDIFTSNYFASNTVCMSCARIHFAEEVLDYYNKEENVINVKDAMNNEVQPGITYKQYLTTNGKNPIIASGFYGSSFSIVDVNTQDMQSYDEAVSSAKNLMNQNEVFEIEYEEGDIKTDEKTYKIKCNNEETNLLLKEKITTNTASPGITGVSRYMLPNKEYNITISEKVIAIINSSNGKIKEYNTIEEADEENFICKTNDDKKITIKDFIANYTFTNNKFNYFKNTNTIIPMQYNTKVMRFPEIIDMNKGDFFITTTTWTGNRNEDTNSKSITQLMLYQWNNGESLNILSKEKTNYFTDEQSKKSVICKEWDGIMN